VQPRLERLKNLLGNPLFESILWGHEYSLDAMTPQLKHRIETKQFNRIVFYGMGCSSVVSDVVKGFFKSQNIPLHVDVVNDYDVDWFLDERVLQDKQTLAIIVCYSGWSVEPCLFYDRMKRLTRNENLLVLSGGGKIADMCKADGTSLIQYKMRHADREYPLYHVQQFFSIFLDLFHKLKVIDSPFQKELVESVAFLKDKFNADTLKQTEDMALRLRDSDIVFLATAKWSGTLLKQVTMFFNEIAMVQAHRHLLHEWSHTEVAAFSNPAQKLAIVAFHDADEDDYTHQKIATMKRLFADKQIAQNKNIEFFTIDLNQKNFFQKYFYANFFTIYVAYHLGNYTNTEGRDLISITAGNPWWSQRSIEKFPNGVDIPGQLGVGEDGARVAG
jgi:glucose/mannose-6-phosphate isomerase